jgi:hypothetical protein
MMNNVENGTRSLFIGFAPFLRGCADWLRHPGTQFQSPTLRWLWRLIVFLGVALAPALGLCVFLAYQLHWDWTGFDGNQYFKWMQLLLVPLALTAGTIWYTRSWPRSGFLELARCLTQRSEVKQAATRFWDREIGIEALALVIAGALATADTLLVIFGVILLLLSWVGMNWTWTGYQDQQLWEWLIMLLLPAAVMFATIWFNAHKSTKDH